MKEQAQKQSENALRASTEDYLVLVDEWYPLQEKSPDMLTRAYKKGYELRFYYESETYVLVPFEDSSKNILTGAIFFDTFPSLRKYLMEEL